MKCSSITKKNLSCKNKGVFHDQDAFFCKWHFKQNCTPTCSICLDDLCRQSDWVITSCKHSFHKACWVNYLETSDKMECPICRSSIQNKDDIGGLTLTISTTSNDELIIFSFDSEMLFGKKGLAHIRKRNVKHRPNYIIKKYFNHYNEHFAEASLPYKNYILDIRFGNVTSKQFMVEDFPLYLQNRVFNENSLILIVDKFYRTLQECFNT